MKLDRRTFFLTGAICSIPAASVAPAKADTSVSLAELMEVIEQLECHQGWETSCVVAAKSFAAWQMRKALSLPMPKDTYAQRHIEGQRESFESYSRSCLADLDRDRGIVYQIASFERALI